MLHDVFYLEGSKMAKIGLDSSVRGICCQIPDLLLATTARRI